MNIYLASRYSRRLELLGYKAELEALGHVVTARWLNGSHQISDNGTPIGDHGEALVEGDSGSQSERAAELRCRFAQEDLTDIQLSACIVNFTEPPRSGHNRGGRHVEYGYAIGLGIGRGSGMRYMVVGHRENLFHWLPWVEFFETWDEAKAVLAKVPTHRSPVQASVAG